MSSYTAKKSIADASSIYGGTKQSRPMSAATSRTNIMSQNGQRVNFGLKKKAIENPEFTASVNEHGIAVFENVPIGVH